MNAPGWLVRVTCHPFMTVPLKVLRHMTDIGDSMPFLYRREKHFLPGRVTKCCYASIYVGAVRNGYDDVLRQGAAGRFGVTRPDLASSMRRVRRDVRCRWVRAIAAFDRRSCSHTRHTE